MKTFQYAQQHLTSSIALSIARGEIKGTLSPETREKVKASAGAVEKIVAKGQPVYGINTGFGPMAQYRISEQNLNALQYNLIRSHSTGSGQPIDPTLVRGLLLARLNNFLQGYSGVHPELVELLVVS